MTDQHKPSFLATFLYNRGAVQIDTKKGFRLKLHETNPDAPLSPIYLNLRTRENPKPGPLSKSAVGLIGAMLWQYAKAMHLKFDAVAGLPNAGTPLAKALVRVAEWSDVRLPYITLGKSETEGGRRIEGVVDSGGAKPGETVLVVDDLITRGDSKREGIETLRAANFVVNDVLVLVDREQGGEDDLKKINVELHALTTLEVILRELHQNGKITEEELGKVWNYLVK